MLNSYKIVPSVIKKASIFDKQSLSGKDYPELIRPTHSKKLGDMVDFVVGDSFLSTDFLTKDVCTKYRFIKTGNLFEPRMIVDFTATQYCKPIGSDVLQDGDILIAKDGNGGGLGETSLYAKDPNHVDFICGEILRIRVKQEYDKWYILAALKSKYFKEYMDIVTPGGSTLRHSKLMALEFGIPFPSDEGNHDVEYVSALVQNLVHKEQCLNEKRNYIDALLGKEISEGAVSHSIPSYKLPTRTHFVQQNRADTGIYGKEYFELISIIKAYKGGFYYLDAGNVYPGRTPDDYQYTDVKKPNTHLWITPKNINSLELLYKTYIYTGDTTKVRDYSIILSGIRYLGYGYFVDKGQTVYCNQNTLIINQSEEMDEQIYLLAFFNSTVGKTLQFAWRVDGLVPIIYSDDLIKIPIPKLDETVKTEIVRTFYTESLKLGNDLTLDNYLSKVKQRNQEIGIYQLNTEIITLKKKIELTIEQVIIGKRVEHNFWS